MFGLKKTNQTEKHAKVHVDISEPIQAITHLERLYTDTREEAEYLKPINGLFSIISGHLLNFYDDLAATYQDNTLFERLISDKEKAGDVGAAVAGTSIAIFWHVARGADDECMRSVYKFIKRLKLTKHQSEIMKKTASHYLLRVTPEPLPMAEMVIPRELLSAMLLVDHYVIDPRLNLGCYLRIQAAENYTSAVCRVSEQEKHRAAAIIGVFDKTYKELYG